MILTELEQYDAELAKRMELLLHQAKSLGATEGVQRLTLVGKNFKKLSIEEAYRLIDPNALQREVEGAHARKYWVGRLHILRKCLALGPFLLIGYALYRALNDYQQDLKQYPDDLYQPFLKLWQYGFHHTTWFTAGTAALLDVGLLLVFLSSILVIVFFESKAQKKSNKFAIRLYGLIDELIDAIAATSTTSTSDVDRIVKTIERVSEEGIKKLVLAIKPISDADTDQIAQTLKMVIEDTLKTSEEVAREAQKTIAALNTELEDLVKQFHSDLGILSSDLLGYDKQVQKLSDTSTKLATASTSLAENASDLTKSIQAFVDIGKDISTQIGSLKALSERW